MLVQASAGSQFLEVEYIGVDYNHDVGAKKGLSKKACAYEGSTIARPSPLKMWVQSQRE